MEGRPPPSFLIRGDRPQRWLVFFFPPPPLPSFPFLPSQKNAEASQHGRCGRGVVFFSLFFLRNGPAADGALSPPSLFLLFLFPNGGGRKCMIDGFLLLRGEGSSCNSCYPPPPPFSCAGGDREKFLFFHSPRAAGIWPSPPPFFSSPLFAPRKGGDGSTSLFRARNWRCPF